MPARWWSSVVPSDPSVDRRHGPRPRATYRLQLHAGFTFADAEALVPQLTLLGVTHLYLSPVLAHTPGSTHGYDVVDHTRVDDELGGRAGLEQLAATAHAAGLGLLVDIVPNHMSVAAPEDLNPAWWAVLTDGPSASTAHWFDIDWAAGEARVVLPVLGDDADAVHREDGIVRYHEHRFPGDDTHYRLAHWREAPTYRRFFDVTTLAGLRVEDPDVFDATHRLLLELLDAGVVDGFRIDHPDGLADPRGYLVRLAHATRGAWTVVEKIVEPGEHLPQDWPCAGTTGYDALRLLDGVLVDPLGEEPLTQLWSRIEPDSWEQVLERSKRLVLDKVLGPELTRLQRRLANEQLHEAALELLVAMPVYRTYLDDRDPRPEDLAVLGAARALAAQRRPDLSAAVYELVERLVTGDDPELTRLFQQTSGPVMAKAVEDTAMYRWHRLVALNEVGGDPGRWGVSLQEWHEACSRRQRDEPLALTALTTHDTKRSHDVRTRLIALSEVTELWAQQLNAWMLALREHGVPDAAAAYLMLQSLVGAWPIDADRLGAYLEKATREAKVHTSWTDPSSEYDAAVQQAVGRALTDAELMQSIEQFVTEIAPLGRRNSLSALALQLTMPGVPDTYQGGELEDLSLVDPDNRRPVDHELRGKLLEQLDGLSTDAVLERVDEGLPRLAVLKAGLALRTSQPTAFGPDGAYVPLLATGARADHVVAFSRGGRAVCVVPRWTRRIGPWADTALALPAGIWRDVITGREHWGEVGLGALLEAFPVALLSRVDG
ncbi:MAG: (1-_4)-alpha-D-glucan 1-alpha-D-glucosylmutase [Frankiales bacterium]|nr:(1->4)-alpha-D-glucan 1-alpha-D-glucosylmutase [Frankiales bacterium]